MFRHFLTLLLIASSVFTGCGKIFVYKPVYETGMPRPSVHAELKEKNPILPFNEVNAADWWWSKDNYRLYVATPEGLYYSSNSGITWGKVKIIKQIEVTETDKKGKLITRKKDEDFSDYPATDVTLTDSLTIYVKLRKPNGKALHLLKNPHKTGKYWKEPVECGFSNYVKFGDFPKYMLGKEDKEKIAQVLNEEKGIDLKTAKDSILLWTRILSPKQSAFVFTPYYILRFQLIDNKPTLAEKVPFPDYVERQEIYWAHSGYMPKELWIWTKKGLFISLDGGANYFVHIKNSVALRDEITKMLEEAKQLESKYKYAEAYQVYSNLLIKYPDSLVDIAKTRRKEVEEMIAQRILEDAQSLEAKKKYSAAFDLYSKVIDQHPSTNAASIAREKRNLVEERVKEIKISKFRRRLKKISNEKVKRALAGLGLSGDEADNLAISINNLGSSRAIYILTKVLEIPLLGTSAYQEYQGMSLYQKLYIVLVAAEKGESKIERLKEWLYLSGETASKVADINAKTLLRK